MHRIPLLYTLLFIGLPCLIHGQTDTVPVFHHNYLVERHTDLVTFADDLVSYAEAHNCSSSLQLKAIRYQRDIMAIPVWETENVVGTMNQLDFLLQRGTILHAEIVKEGERKRRRKQLMEPITALLPYLLAVLCFPVVYFLLFRRR